jgi:MFS family permease
VEASDWRTTTLLLAVGGLALAVFAWATVRDRWRGSGGLGQALAGLAIILRHPQTWLIALTGLGTSGPLLGFASLWGVPFLETTYGLQRTQAATLTSLVFVGWGIGAPLFGWFSDWIGRRRPALVAGLTFETVSLAVLVYIPGLSLWTIAALCLLVGFFGSSQIVVFALARENHTTKLSGTAIGFVNGMVTGAGALFQPLVGLLLDLAWTGQTAAGARIYDLHAYRLALASLIACCLAGLLCLLAVRETYCRPQA